MDRLLNGLAYLAAIVGVLYALFSYARFPENEDARRPPVSYAEQPPDVHVPPYNVSEPRRTFTIDLSPQQPSIGTAFAIGGGWWLTARHVADGCDTIGLVQGPRKGIGAQQIVLHPNADVALLSVQIDPEPFAFLNEDLQKGQDGFAIGYPQGSPGGVYAQLMGLERMKQRGRYHTDELVRTWAERKRAPDSLPSLGGLSGGPMFNDRGQVIGILVASTNRRGRVYTSDLTSVRWLLEQASVFPSPYAPLFPLAADNFVGQGDTLREDFRIAQVFCDVKQPSRRRRH
jgi:serine protease Do